mmetsp:Transcript_3165/g.6687  ORF Transcript_3165/g.6687 Transcript_3165/m.6687 type:complete len:215 (-) Transcript_3165:415-1059(-)
MAFVLSSFRLLSASHICNLSVCHFPGVGETVVTMCTRIASKIAWQSVCSGIEMASSSAVMAGYLDCLIFCSIAAGRVTALEVPCSLSVKLNMKFFHSRHHFRIEDMSPSKQLITVGRYTTPCERVLMVFVTRSGIEVSRLSPRDLSLRNPEMMCRLERSSIQRVSVSSRPLHPSAAIRSRSSLNWLCLKTSRTGTSFVSSGASMKSCTLVINWL